MTDLTLDHVMLDTLARCLRTRMMVFRSGEQTVAIMDHAPHPADYLRHLPNGFFRMVEAGDGPDRLVDVPLDAALDLLITTGMISASVTH